MYIGYERSGTTLYAFSSSSSVNRSEIVSDVVLKEEKRNIEERRRRNDSPLFFTFTFTFTFCFRLNDVFVSKFSCLLGIRCLYRVASISTKGKERKGKDYDKLSQLVMLRL